MPGCGKGFNNRVHHHIGGLDRCFTSCASRRRSASPPARTAVAAAGRAPMDANKKATVVDDVKGRLKKLEKEGKALAKSCTKPSPAEVKRTAWAVGASGGAPMEDARPRRRAHFLTRARPQAGAACSSASSAPSSSCS